LQLFRNRRPWGFPIIDGHILFKLDRGAGKPKDHVEKSFNIALHGISGFHGIFIIQSATPLPPLSPLDVIFVKPSPTQNPDEGKTWATL